MNFLIKNQDHHSILKMMVRKTKITLLFILVSGFLVAQNGINYKAVIKDANGNVIVNESIQVQFTILQDATNVYQETHAPTTDANGFIVLNIGQGTSSDVFTAINWSSDAHFLNVQIDAGSGLVDLGTTPFMQVPYAIQAKKAEKAANVTGLEAIDEGNGMGWRLVGNDPDNYGDIGVNALDFSEQPQPINLGATGELSVAFGRYSEASGYSSFAMGNVARASGEQTLAFGEQCTASGDFSVAMGFSNLVAGNYSSALGRSNITNGDYSLAAGMSNQISSGSLYSFAFGHANTISGSRSIAFGSSNDITSSGSYALGFNNDVNSSNSYAFGNNNELQHSNSFVMGSNNISSDNTTYAFGFNNENLESGTYVFGNSLTAHSTSEMVFGQFNTTYSPVAETLSWSGNSNRLFVVANGYIQATGVIVRRNALTILKSGNIGVGTDTPQERLHVNGRLRIGTETIEDTGSNQLSVDASLIPTTNNAFRLGNSSNRWVGVWATDGTINTSDRREKKNIKNLEYGLDEVLQMQPVSFNWKDKNIPDAKLGLIAQNLLKIVPEVVKTHIWEKEEATGTLTKTELDRLGVYYSDLVPVLIKAIQEQQTTINSLQSTIQNNNNTIITQNQVSLEQSKTLQTLLTRVQALEGSNH